MLNSVRNFTFPRSHNPQVVANDEEPTKVADLMPLAPDGVEKLMTSPDIEEKHQGLKLKALLFGESTDTVETRPQPRSERLVNNFRGPVLTTIQASLSLVGAALFGPVGLGVGALTQAGLSFARNGDEPLPTRLKNSLQTAALATAVGVVGLVPGAIGAVATTATAGGIAFLADRQEELDAPSLIAFRMTDFAQEYVPRAQAKLGDKASLDLPKFEGVSAKKAEKLALAAINSATQVVCEQLSPTAAVSLAQESAKTIVPQGSVTEDMMETLLTIAPSAHLDSNIRLSSISADTPAAATIRTVLLTPEFARENSPEAVTAAVGHEQSHIDHRDPIAKLGDLTIKKALEISSDQSLNPLTWMANDKLSQKIKLASAQISQEVEYRCDREGVDKMLASGATQAQVESGFAEIFQIDPGSTDPLAEHPLSADRMTAVKSHLSDLNKAKLETLFSQANFAKV